MQLGNALESPDEDAAVARVPAAVSLYTTTPRATSDARLQVWARLHASTADVTCSFRLRTDAGATLMHMSELVAKPMTKGATTSTKIAVHSTRDAMYAIRWLAQTADATTAAPRALATTTIRVDGASSARAWISSSVYAALSVVQTLSLLDNSEQSVAVHLQTACAVASVAAMTRTSSSSRDGAAIRGLWRTAAQELRHPALTGGTDADEFALHLPHSRNIVDADAQGHAYRGGYWMRAGVRRCTAATPEHAVQLRPQPRGAINDLIAVVEAAGDDASSTMMRVRVSAVGINFRDVLNVLGMYPGDPGPPGGDCAGTVARACARTAALGESVFGLAAGCLGNYVHAYGDTFAALPAHLRHEAAASMPTVFVTVDLALSQAARTRGGERVLVHAAAGGVGVAATQLAGALDATVYATAGSSAKRYWVRSHAPAVRHVGSSRATTFPDVASMTLGAVDVVLNSLTSAGVVAATVSCMSSRARFVEIGKRDIWTAATLGAERSDATLRLVAVDFLPQAAMRKGMHRVATCASTMQYRPLSTTAHTLVRSHAALRQMSQARHVGKIVVCSPRAVRDDVLAGGVGDGVLVCGGLGSLGALTASWLASMSTCHLHLLGRSGRRGEGLEALVASASLVRMQRCDAATAGDRAVVTAANGPNAVVHAGGVLADATLAQQRASGVRRVFAAKVDSLGTLVQATHANAVSAQVLFSSLAAFLGSPGQSNYCAANAALDAAAHAAHASGERVLSLQWGAWIGGGMAANDTSTIGRMERAGVGVVTPELGLAVLGGALSSLLRASAPAGAVLTVSPFDWTRFLAQQPAYADAAFFADVRAAEEGVAPLAETKSQEVAGTRRRRGAQPHAASEQHVQQQLSEAIRGVLGSDVSADEPLMAAGLDSLGAVELRNAVETRMGLQLPGTLVFDYPTVSAMASYVTSRLAPDDEELAADDDIASVADSSLTSDGVMACVTSSAGCTPGEHVESGRRSDGIAGIPLDRWDAEAEALRTGDDASLVRRFGGFMRNVDMFDASLLRRVNCGGSADGPAAAHAA